MPARLPSTPVVPSKFDVFALPAHEQLLAWRDRLGQIIDVVPSLAQLALPFRASIQRYDIGPFFFAHCYTDQVTLNRTIARISQDNARNIVFNIFLDGGPASVIAQSARRQGEHHDVGIIAVDLDQPIHVMRQGCRHVTFFMPASVLQPVLPDPGALHRRVLAPGTPAVRLIVERVVPLFAHLHHMPADEAYRSLYDLAHLIGAAFGEAAGLKGSKRAIARELMFEQVRRFVSANLTDAALSPEYVLAALGLPRPTVYRLFQHEGGLAAYIRQQRLRAAVSDLVRFPEIAVKDIGYAVGFKSASDFTRAFRREYDMAPNEIRPERTRETAVEPR